MKVAFIGLGVMGYSMAGHLQKEGHQVCVYNRTTAKAIKWQQEFGGEYATTPAKAVENCEMVFSCVGNDDDLRQVALGENGILSALEKDAIFVDHTTASADVAKELAAKVHAQRNDFLDAPVSGGEAGAINGVLTIMIGGDDNVYKKVQPVIDAYAKFSQLMGPVGSGQLAKMVNQICIAGVVQGLAEGFNFAQKVGLDPNALVETIAKGAAGSWQMENRYKTMFAKEFDFGFAVDWMRKDLAIAFNEAEKQGAELPLTRMVDGFYEKVQASGGNRWDTSSLISLFDK